MSECVLRAQASRLSEELPALAQTPSEPLPRTWLSVDHKRGQRKGATSKDVRNRRRVSNILSALFDMFRAGQKTSIIVGKWQKYFRLFRAGQKRSKIVRKCQKYFRHFSTTFAPAPVLRPLLQGSEIWIWFGPDYDLKKVQVGSNSGPQEGVRRGSGPVRLEWPCCSFLGKVLTLACRGLRVGPSKLSLLTFSSLVSEDFWLYFDSSSDRSIFSIFVGGYKNTAIAEKKEREKNSLFSKERMTRL